MNFSMSGANHLTLRIEREPLLSLEEHLFMLLTAGTMLMLIAGIILDVQRKFGWIVLLRRWGLRTWAMRESVERGLREAVRIGRKLLIE